MKLVEKAILRELLWAFLLALPALGVLLALESLLRLSRVVSTVGASAGEMLRLLALAQPELLLLTAPVGFLLSVLYTYGRLVQDGELMALRLLGLSLWQASRPVLALALLSMAVALAAGLWAGPWARTALRAELTRLLTVRAPQALRPGTFSRLLEGSVLYVRGRQGGSLQGVFIYQHRPEGSLVVHAQEGRLGPVQRGRLSLSLRDGLIHVLGGPGQAVSVRFGSYRASFPLWVDTPGQRLAELDLQGLLDRLSRAPGAERPRLFLELYRRLSFGLLPLAFMPLAPVLALRAGRRARLGGLAMGLGLFALYYIALQYAEQAALAGLLSPHVAAWLPLGLLGVAGLWALRRAG